MSWVSLVFSGSLRLDPDPRAHLTRAQCRKFRKEYGKAVISPSCQPHGLGLGSLEGRQVIRSVPPPPPSSALGLLRAHASPAPVGATSGNWGRLSIGVRTCHIRGLFRPACLCGLVPLCQLPASHPVCGHQGGHCVWGWGASRPAFEAPPHGSPRQATWLLSQTRFPELSPGDSANPHRELWGWLVTAFGKL